MLSIARVARVAFVVSAPEVTEHTPRTLRMHHGFD
jgi:hypothetical protein